MLMATIAVRTSTGWATERREVSVEEAFALKTHKDDLIANNGYPGLYTSQLIGSENSSSQWKLCVMCCRCCSSGSSEKMGSNRDK
jgi:hypothetical protein